MRSLILAFAVTCLAGAASAQTPAPAAKPADKPAESSISVGVTIFSNFAYTASPESKDADGNSYNPSSFNVDRAYINVTGKFSKFSFRVTPDIARETGTGSSLSGSQTFRLKYALVQANLSKSIWIRGGIQQTPYVEYTEKIYGYRFQGPTFADREGYLSSADAGVSLGAELPKGYGDIHVGVYNGENYNKPEANDQKAFMARVGFRPFPNSPFLKGFRVAGFHDRDAYVRNGERRRNVGQASFTHTRGTVGAELLKTRDRTSATKPSVRGEGYSLWVVPKFGRGLEGLFRYDSLEPDSGTDRERNRTIAGLAYWVPNTGKATVGVLANYERARATGTAASERLALHTVLTF